MNLIDKHLDVINTLTADEFIQAMGRIYEEHIDRQDVLTYPQFVQDIIFIVDYDTELAMNGLCGFLTNDTGLYFSNTITALENCGALEEAKILEKCAKIGFDNSELIEQLSLKTYMYTEFDIWELLIAYVELEIKNTY